MTKVYHGPKKGLTGCADQVCQAGLDGVNSHPDSTQVGLDGGATDSPQFDREIMVKSVPRLPITSLVLVPSRVSLLVPE
jgi:hypothetical protein